MIHSSAQKSSDKKAAFEKGIQYQAEIKHRKEKRFAESGARFSRALKAFKGKFHSASELRFGRLREFNYFVSKKHYSGQRNAEQSKPVVIFKR